MRLVIIADLHANLFELKSLWPSLDIKKDDLLIMAGDLTDAGVKGATEIGKQTFKDLESRFNRILTVPGNMIPIEFKNWLVAKKSSIHSRGGEIGGVGFFGFGGAKTPFNTPYEPGEDEIKEGLEKGFKQIKDCKEKVMVVHNPPKNTKLDRIPDGTHVGSQAVREAIQEYQPDLTICAHVHESSGKDKIGESLIYYPGPLLEGKAGVVDLEGMEIKTITLD